MTGHEDCARCDECGRHIADVEQWPCLICGRMLCDSCDCTVAHVEEACS